MKKPNFSGKRILVTGGFGFIGATFVNLLTEELGVYPDDIWILDSHTYAANPSRVLQLDKINVCPRNIADPEAYSSLPAFDIIFHFAAETHVDNSLESAGVFIDTNVKGTYNLLEHARKYNSRFIHISTDEVYGDLPIELARTGMKFSEGDDFAPNSPYSITKASAEMLVETYRKFYKLDVRIIRPCNNFGPGQHREKFLLKAINKMIAGEKIPVYGNGENLREWLYAPDCAKLIAIVTDVELTKSYLPHIVNIGSGNLQSNLEMVLKLIRLMSVKDEWYMTDYIEFVKDRVGHDRAYSLNLSYMQQLLYDYDYKPTNFNVALSETVGWVRNHV